MSVTVYVIDTSYLLELFSVPGFSNLVSVERIKKRFEKAIESKSRLFVPLPCLFELADHIADVKDGRRRAELAKGLFLTVKSCIEDSIPWSLIPPRDPQIITELFRSFSKNYAIRALSLTDTTVIEEAKRLHKTHRSFNYKVHIWTKDKKLKALEPDRERDQFIG